MRINDQQTSAVCEVLDVSRSAYYAWLTPERSAHEARDAELSPLVRDIFWKHRRRYGTRRIVAELAERGELCGARRVAKLPENTGAFRHSAKIIRAQDDRQQAQTGIQPEPVARSAGTHRDPPTVGRRHHLRAADGR